VKHGESEQRPQLAADSGRLGPNIGMRLLVATIAAVPGLIVGALGGLIVLYGAIRLGIGRRGEAWWRPFENELTRPHVENLATFALGVIAVAVGAWLAASAFRRALRRG
jgi:hypothetical protein